MTTSIFEAQTPDVVEPGPAGPSNPNDGVFEYSPDHVERGVGQLIEVFRKPRNMQWLSSAVGQLQDVEDALWQLYNGFDVDTAVGEALDFLGTVVGEARSQRADEDYRAAVRARILVNQSNGRLEDMIAVVRALVPAMGPTDLHVVEHYPAAISFELYDDFTGASSETIARMLRQAKPAGVRLSFIPVNTAETLIWRSPAGPDAVNGWGAKWARRL